MKRYYLDATNCARGTCIMAESDDGAYVEITEIERLQSRVAELEAEKSALIKTVQRDTLTRLKQQTAHAAAVLQAKQLRDAAKLNVPTAFYEDGIWFFGTDESASQVDPCKSKLLDALATTISTEALDKYVAEKAKISVEYAEAGAVAIINNLHGQIATLTRQRDLAVEALERYRNETPLGNQPHMIAHEVDSLLSSIKESEGK